MQKSIFIALCALAVGGTALTGTAQNVTAPVDPNLLRLFTTGTYSPAVPAPPVTETFISRPFTARIIVPAARDAKFVHQPPTNYTFATPVISATPAMEAVVK